MAPAVGLFAEIEIMSAGLGVIHPDCAGVYDIEVIHFWQIMVILVTPLPYRTVPDNCAPFLWGYGVKRTPAAE